MSKISALKSEIIPKIAAGEVVERPSSVVKELVENSLDSGAKNIVVEVENSGLTRIKVIDDGEGMDQQDLLNCFLSYTTSKIQKLEDLANVKTFGFRGEALASICAVADVTIKSFGATEKSGNSILIRDSTPATILPVGMNRGTIIEVSNLFSYTPARKKFLKSSLHENQFILQTLNAFALSHLQAGFEYYRDGKQVFKIFPKDTLIQRIEKLLGTYFAQNVLPIEFLDEYIKINGVISKPQISEKNRNNQFLFVNQRYVDDLALSKTIKDAYKTLLDARSYPPFIMNINLDWNLVDVNVHPQKEKVKFWNESVVKNCVYKAVESTLANFDLTYVLGDESNQKASRHLYTKLKDVTPIWQVREGDTAGDYDKAFQISDTYIIYPSKAGLFLVDQHAAHESILYKQLLQSYAETNSQAEKYILEKPLIIDIPPNRMPVLEENLDYLQKIGFEIEIFGSNTIKFLAVRELFKDHDLRKLILEVINDLAEEKSGVDIDEHSKKTLAYLACRSAIKAGDKLNTDEIKRLLVKLDESFDIYTCPHGRPVKIKLTQYELEKMFKRVK